MAFQLRSDGRKVVSHLRKHRESHPAVDSKCEGPEAGETGYTYGTESLCPEHHEQGKEQHDARCEKQARAGLCQIIVRR